MSLRQCLLSTHYRRPDESGGFRPIPAASAFDPLRTQPEQETRATGLNDVDGTLVTTIYCLMHSYDAPSGEAEEKILGYFGGRDEAEDAISHYVALPGFRQYPAGFLVEQVQLGRLHWEDGFETVVDNEPVSD